ncbi:iron ABC transporter permease [Curvibacter sp. CHRR-16]|uniref:FecCD family ABC transporter permease n=1 Tax=Curvibacter sp. CHRR-16 TaxID=2835872 RepID=UPI001BD95246|nr:iron ABC transporter permease [Curvibacter sp. CHRR-16]MBT0568868.1 iron ABC transporter permease [Curvibacter sp. CHRR-16]
MNTLVRSGALRLHTAWGVGGLLLLCLLLAVWAGAVSVQPQDWLALWTREDGQPLSGSAYVLWHLRLPRIVFALLVGAALGWAGALTQGLFRNPLADPGLLGVSSGAACAAALTIVLLAQSGLAIPFAWRYALLPVAAFTGAVVVCWGLDSMARWITADSMAGLLLTGIALNAIAGAVIGLCTYLATDEQLRSLSFWTMGSMAAASWWLVLVMAVLLVVGHASMQRSLRAMNALALGEAAAAHVGIGVRALRQRVVLLVAVVSGFAVAWCGVIAFVGLIAPHIVRSVLGPDQRWVAPGSMAVGGVLLLLADTAARTVAIPAEVPVGIFTSLMGAPFFLLLLLGLRRRGVAYA